MCGIYGFVGKVKKGKKEKMKQIIEALAFETMIRGEDSTGFYARSDEWEFSEKNVVPADEFYEDSELFEEAIDNGSFLFVGHNRWASIGDISNDNAHPFVGDNYVLAHNGTCFNALKRLKRLRLVRKMEGDTDSEALLRCLDKQGLSKKFFKGLDDYSIVVVDRVTSTVYFARDDTKPLVVYDFRKLLGVRIFASTKSIAEEAFEICGISTEDVYVFHTKPFHLYSVDPSTGEVTNEGEYEKRKPVTTLYEYDYKTPSVIDKVVDKVTDYGEYVFKHGTFWKRNSGKDTGKPKSSYTVGWSGGDPD